MIDVRKGKDIYLADFARFTKAAAGSRSPLLPVRESALDRFQALGFPTPRHEEWRFTNTAPIAGTPFRLAGRDGAAVAARHLEDALFGQADWPRLVFVNGHYAPQWSAPGGAPEAVKLVSLGQALEETPQAVQAHLAKYAKYDDHAFTALNTAFMADGAYVHVPQGVRLETPIHLLFLSTGQADADPTVSYPRNLIVADAGSEATIIESYVGRGDGIYFTNAVTEIVAGENAVIDHYKLERETERAYHVGATQLHQARHANVTSHTVSIGGALVRNNISTVLDGEGGHCTLNGLYLAAGRQHVDNHLRVEHVKPHCDSREFFKGILEGRSKAVFTGRIVVHPDAQKTDAKQTNMNLLLSEGAKVDTKPQLEIFADDVKCTHGATIGQLEQDAIFYLRSRGISEEAARGVLVYAFAGESIDKIRPEPLRAQLRETLFDRLPQGELLREAI
ncbi:MAG: Fe-S cluster assembly protein SufD [Planctomycetota bacterium]|jgi:Fe-S cluster assembly protein SufD